MRPRFARTRGWEASHEPYPTRRVSGGCRQPAGARGLRPFQGRQHGRPRRCRPATRPEAIVALPLGDIAGARRSSSASVPNPYGSSPRGGAARPGPVRPDELRRLSRLRREGRHGAEPHRHLLALRRHAGADLQVDLRRPAARHAGVESGVAARRDLEAGRLHRVAWRCVSARRSTQAAMQGDRVGDNVAPEVQRTTLPASASASGPQANGKGASTSSAEARPDAGGSVPTGAKP